MTLLPPKEYTNRPASVDVTDQAAVQANLTAVAQDRAYRMNQDLSSDYINSTFGSWNASYQAGKLDWNANPPQPPNSFMVQPIDGSWGFNYVQAGTPVCAIPPYNRIPAPQGTLPPGHIHIGKNIPGSNYWAAGADDTATDGTMTSTTTADDGATGVFRKIGFFMGNGWWLKLS